MAKQVCPYCEGTGRIMDSVRCPACEGFKVVDTAGVLRAKLFQALKKEGVLDSVPPPDFGTKDCYF